MDDNKIKEIKDLKGYLVNTYYAKLRAEQRIDEQYYNDKFAVPQIKHPVPISRTGRGARMVDSPSEHIITSNPQAFRVPIIKGGVATKGDENERLSVMFNQMWIPHLKKQNPNPFKQSVKDNMLYGESWVHILHNESWVTGKMEKKGLPIVLLSYNPQVIFADPNEDENGIPERLVLWYYRVPWIIKKRYPSWSNPKKRKDGDGDVEWFGYWDKDDQYFEADGEVVFQNKNPYGFVPWVHSLSGFGKTSSEGEPAEMIVGRLRKVRDTLVRECAITSSIDAQIYLMGQPQHDFETDPGVEVTPEQIESYTVGLGVVNVLPPGVKRVKADTPQPTAEMFQHLYNTRSELEREDPSVMSGSPVGTSGRQQEGAAASAMRRYDTIVENVENQFATIFSMGLRIMDKIPAFPLPNGVNKNDIDKNYEVSVKLKAADPLDDDRKATLGSRLVSQGEIDIKTNLVQYKGYTEDEAERIITQILIDKVTLQSPEIAELLGMRAAEKSGMSEDLMALRIKRQMMEQQQSGLSEAPSATEQQRRSGQIESPLSRETIDRALTQRGARNPPER